MCRGIVHFIRCLPSVQRNIVGPRLGTQALLLDCCRHTVKKLYNIATQNTSGIVKDTQSDCVLCTCMLVVVRKFVFLSALQYRQSELV